MADSDNVAKRTVGRIMQFFGITNSRAISNTPNGLPKESIHYGMYTRQEVSHMPGLSMREQQSPTTKPQDIMSYLQSVSSNTRRQIENIKNIKIIAPEIKMAEQIIISSIISPTDLQTDLISVSVEVPTLSDDVNAKLSKRINDHFNDQLHFGSKLKSWLTTAGFKEGAKAVIVLPHSELGTMNAVADVWDPEAKDILLDAKSDSSVEALFDSTASLKELVCGEDVIAATEALFEDAGISLESSDGKPSDKDKVIKDLIKHNFDILSENSGVITVTKNLKYLSKGKVRQERSISRLAREAAKQFDGFDPESPDSRPEFGVFTINDVIEAQKGDMPIILEIPADSVIPVCAPRDVTNHIGYWVVIDENGQPAQGEYAFNGGSAGGVSRLAYNSARAVYGNNIMQTFDLTGNMNNDQTIEMMSKVFAVAVNKLLTSKMREEGLTGLNIELHNAVGKSIFYNLLAKTKVRLVFVPESMMIYYRFDHRDDGTGKTFLEDIDFILSLRTTLTIAKIMAAIDNATKHRTIEVNVDEQNKNPLETIENVRRAFLTKYAPSFTTDPSIAAESILNQHVTITPKAIAGTTDDLSVSLDSRYGSSQAPDQDLFEMLNNMSGLGLMVPPSALNQLAETEYSRSVATSNLMFSNAVRGWQNDIKPYNKKFAMNYLCAHHGLLEDIKKILKDQDTRLDKSVKDGISPDIDQSKNSLHNKLMEVIAAVEINLPTPNVSMTKAQYEEIQSYMDAVANMVEKIFPDDMASGDSDAQSQLSALRAVIIGNILREYMDKIGFHEIASIPTTDEALTDDMIDSVTFLLNAKRRIENMAKLHKGESSQASDGGSDGF